MTAPSTDRPQPVALGAVRNGTSTAWQMIATLGFMIIIGLVGAVWLPWIADLVNRAAV